MDMTRLWAIAIAATPLLAMAAIVWFADRIRMRRDARYARQIALTDAIHRELGAVAAPTVHQRPGGAWRVSLMLPLDRPALVATIVRITEQVFGAAHWADRRPFHIVLTPVPSGTRAQVPGARHRAAPPARRPAAALN
jgi:hypothetical protein